MLEYLILATYCLLILFFHLHCSSQYPFAKLRFALEDFRVVHRDSYCEYSFGNWYSEIGGTLEISEIYFRTKNTYTICLIATKKCNIRTNGISKLPPLIFSIYK